MQINRLSPVLGAEITDLDVSRQLSNSEFDAVHQAWIEHDGLLVIRDQNLTPEQQITFSRHFGPLFGEADQFQESVHRYLHPDFPAIYRVSNKVKDGQPQGRAKAGNYWHSDVSFRARPASASILYAIEIPELGGDTMFANMYAALDALSDGMKSMLAAQHAVHDFQRAAQTSGTYTAEQLQSGDFDGANRCAHPVITTHPESGRPVLFVNPGFTASLENFTAEESAPILDYLFALAVQSEFVYRHRWAPGDLVIWDNRCLMHYAITDYTGDRYLHRTTVIGEKPV